MKPTPIPPEWRRWEPEDRERRRPPKFIYLPNGTAIVRREAPVGLRPPAVPKS